MQHVNKISQFTQWKEIKKEIYSIYSILERVLNGKDAKWILGSFRWMLQQKLAWNVRPNLSFSNCTSEEILSFDILKCCSNVTNSRERRLLSTVGFFSDSFISRGKYFQGKVKKSATRNISAETIRLFYLLINNFKLKQILL